jgi:hypothetical protein
MGIYALEEKNPSFLKVRRADVKDLPSSMRF